MHDTLIRGKFTFRREARNLTTLADPAGLRKYDPMVARNSYKCQHKITASMKSLIDGKLEHERSSEKQICAQTTAPMRIYTSAPYKLLKKPVNGLTYRLSTFSSDIAEKILQETID